MKKVTKAALLACMTFFAFSFSACSDADEDDSVNKGATEEKSSPVVNPDGDKTSVLKSVTYKRNAIELKDNNYYVDASLSADQYGSHVFKTLQEAIAAIPDGSKGQPNTLYLASDVYWTDDYSKAERREKNDLVGLVCAQKFLTMRGLSGNRDDVVICSDRGQNAGADGNFNTMSISSGFCAYDITFANYCNVDLVYARDPSKNHSKRQAAITQAQVLITHDSQLQDYHYFENCSFVSRLNLLALGYQHRSYFTNCHFECTDDSMPGGEIAIVENSTIDWYASSPHWDSASMLQAYLGCKITVKSSVGSTGMLLSKDRAQYAIIDCEFTSENPDTPIEWQKNGIKDQTRCIVYNNKMNGQPLTISPNSPLSSVTLSEKSLTAFKVGDKYNIYNLLNTSGLDEWDPANQKAEMTAYIAPWYVIATASGTVYGDSESSASLSAKVYGGNDSSVTWTLPEGSKLTLDGTKIMCGKVDEATVQYVNATTSNGITVGAYTTVKPSIKGTPVFTTQPTVSISNGKVILNYEFSNTEYETTAQNPDRSLISWYKGTMEDGSDKVKVAESRYVYDSAVAFKEYPLTNLDVGYYFFAEVTPKQLNSNEGSLASCSTAGKVTESDITNAREINADFEHLVYTKIDPEQGYDDNKLWKNDALKKGFWYGGSYLPKAYEEGGDGCDDLSSKSFNINPKEEPWYYGEGIDGALGKYGYINKTRGAKLLFNNTSESKAMKATLVLNPAKKAAQGFGSASQFADILIKYDQASNSGYGLRIMRQASVEEKDSAFAEFVAKSVVFKLIKYDGGSVTQLAESVVSTAYLATCTVVMNYTDEKFSVDVTTTAEQGEAQREAGMAHEVHLECANSSTLSSASGFMFCHTGTTSLGNTTSIESLKIEY
ncbi:MAG: hypothetical protein IJT42_07215 [Treponema sp.]|nr:hypothetical protein [Treponema sp.]